ncbi:type II secretion system protein J, partial [Burkholderia sp. SIMBA_019]
MTPRRVASHAQAGFTLIEVLVALALMALVSLMAWRGLD